MYTPLFSAALVGLGLAVVSVGGQDASDKPVPYCKRMRREDCFVFNIVLLRFQYCLDPKRFAANNPQIMHDGVRDL